MWCSRMSKLSQPPSASEGYAYAAENIPILEAAFTLTLQAVLTEQPTDPVAWAAGFLGELAAERASEREARESARPSVAARAKFEETSAALDAAQPFLPVLPAAQSPALAMESPQAAAQALMPRHASTSALELSPSASALPTYPPGYFTIPPLPSDVEAIWPVPPCKPASPSQPTSPRLPVPAWQENKSETTKDTPRSSQSSPSPTVEKPAVTPRLAGISTSVSGSSQLSPSPTVEKSAATPRLASTSASRSSHHSAVPTDGRGVASPRLAHTAKDRTNRSPSSADGRDPFNLGIIPSTPNSARACASPRSASTAPSPRASSSSPKLDAEEILKSLRTSGAESIQRLANSMALADREGRGRLRVREFTRAFAQARLRIDAAKAACLHAYFDRSGTGEILLSDIISALRSQGVRIPDHPRSPRSSPRPRAQPLETK